MGVVDESVEDGIGERGVGHGLVPLFNRELAGHDGGSRGVAVVEDFKQMPLRVGGERMEAPVVEYECVDS